MPLVLWSLATATTTTDMSLLLVRTWMRTMSKNRPRPMNKNRSMPAILVVLKGNVAAVLGVGLGPPPFVLS